jgi:hypothetical protein
MTFIAADDSLCEAGGAKAPERPDLDRPSADFVDFVVGPTWLRLRSVGGRDSPIRQSDELFEIVPKFGLFRRGDGSAPTAWRLARSSGLARPGRAAFDQAERLNNAPSRGSM